MRTCALFLVLGLVTPSSAAPPARPDDALASFLRAHAETRGYMLGRPVAPMPTADGKSALFLRSPPRSPELALYELDAASGQARELLTPARVLAGAEENLSPAERARRERARVILRGFTSFALSEDGARVLVTLSGRVYLYERATQAVNALPPTGVIDPRLSPSGTRVAYVRDRDLYVFELATKKERRLTTSLEPRITNGLAEFVAQEEMMRMSGTWWSPDGAQLAFEEADTRPVETFHLADPAHPEREPQALPYPRAGGENARVRLGVVSAAGGRVTFIDWDRGRYPYLVRVVWKDGPLTLVVSTRDQKEQAVLAADPKTGRSRVLLTEKDDAWLNIDPTVPRWVSGGFLWSSERSGTRALELRDESGALLRTLTGSDDGYESIAGVDPDTIWYHGGPEATEQQLYRVPLAGGPPERVTREPGVHQAFFHPSGSAYVLASTTLDRMPRAVLIGSARKAPAGDEPELPSVAETPPAMPPPVVERVGAADWWVAITRPRDFKPERRYPVVVDVYGGPHHQQVTRALGPFLMRQWLADHGYVVISIDGRGTPRRGRVWERAIAGNFAGVTLDDQVDALRAAAARHPEMDLARVGIYGWSFGGYLSALALLKRPDVFAVGVAGAPVADWRDYDTFYTERYLGQPQTSPDAYRQSSLLTWAAALERPLLILHGTSDDNVYFLHSLKLGEALFRAQRPFTLVPLPGLTHMVPDPALRVALYERIAAHLASTLKPR